MSVRLSVVALALDPAVFLCARNGPYAPHDIVFPMVSYADVVESVCFPLGVPFDVVVGGSADGVEA